MARKYRKGHTIYSLDELYYHLEAGRWVFFRERPVHPGFIDHMTFGTVCSGINANLFHKAERNANL